MTLWVSIIEYENVHASQNGRIIVQRNGYSAGAVKFSFWFFEFRKVVNLLDEGNSMDDIKMLNDTENIFGASTPRRSQQIWSTVSARIKTLDSSFYSVFLNSDVSSQKIFALIAAMAHDTLFSEFVYEVIREKIIVGDKELSDSDIRIFFKNKQEQSDKVAEWTEDTLKRLGRSYNTMLSESGLVELQKDARIIKKPILDISMENWLYEHGMNYYVNAVEGVK